MLSAVAFSPALAKDTNVIAVFGDSLAAGYGVAPENTFPAQLEKKLIADGHSVKVINDGVSGDTTAGGVARVEYVLKQKPDAVILILGGNDLLRGLPPSEVEKNLTVIVQRLHAADVKLLIAGQKAPFTLGVAYAQQYNAIFCDLAKQYDAECYPFFLATTYGHADLMQNDGIHPNTQGVATIINALYPQVLALLKK